MALATRSRQSERAERRARTRDRLLAAATGLLEEGLGYGEISVDRLSSAAGITRTTFYVYFESKSDLLLAWLEAAAPEVDRAAASWWATERAPARAEFRDLIADVLGAYESHAPVLGAAYDASLFDDDVKAAFQAMMDRRIDGLRAHIERGQDGGWIDASLPPGQTATWLTWMIQRGQHTTSPRGDRDRRRLAGAYADILLNALYRPRSR